MAFFLSLSLPHPLSDASGSVRCWYVWGAQCVWSLKETEVGGGGGEGGVQRQTHSLSISPSGERAVTGGSDSALHLYDLSTHQRLQVCKARYSVKLHYP